MLISSLRISRPRSRTIRPEPARRLIRQTQPPGHRRRETRVAARPRASEHAYRIAIEWPSSATSRSGHLSPPEHAAFLSMRPTGRSNWSKREWRLPGRTRLYPVTHGQHARPPAADLMEPGHRNGGGYKADSRRWASRCWPSPRSPAVTCRSRPGSGRSCWRLSASVRLWLHALHALWPGLLRDRSFLAAVSRHRLGWLEALTQAACGRLRSRLR